MRDPRVYEAVKSEVRRLIKKQRRMEANQYSSKIGEVIRSLQELKQELSSPDPDRHRANARLQRAYRNLKSIVDDDSFWNKVDPGQTHLGSFTGHLSRYSGLRNPDDYPKVISAIDDFMGTLRKAQGVSESVRA